MILWSQMRDYLELAALEHPSCYDMVELRAMVERGELLSVCAFDGCGLKAAALCEQIEMRDGKTLHVRLLGGDDMQMWLDDMQEALQLVARGYGCRWISLTGRQGWRKVLGRLGWNPVAIQMRCEVTI